MKEFRVQIIVGDFTVSTVEKANTKDEIIKKVFLGQNYNEFDEIKITCEEIPKKSAFQEWNENMFYWHICGNEHQIQDNCRKEGYNFALDLVKKELNLMPDEIIKIEQLKEP